MQSAYEADETGRLVPALPEACPHGDDGSACRVVAHHTRQRKTGPRLSLVVARCVCHQVSFTLYPPGQVPYGRTAITPVDPAGRPVSDESGEGRSLWGTLWEAARDAQDGQRWPEQGAEAGCRRTQGRRLDVAESVLGLRGCLQSLQQHAYELGVPTLIVHEAAARPGAAASTWRQRGQRVMRVLVAVLRTGRPGGLLQAGHAAGLWGAPRRWDPGGELYTAAL